jgi:hypothetical protein
MLDFLAHSPAANKNSLPDSNCLQYTSIFYNLNQIFPTVLVLVLEGKTFYRFYDKSITMHICSNYQINITTRFITEDENIVL